MSAAWGSWIVLRFMYYIFFDVTLHLFIYTLISILFCIIVKWCILLTNALLPFTTRARLLISKLVNVTTIYSDVLINATNVINSDTELATLWNVWYNDFNPHEKVHGPEICRAILSKLINSAFGVVLKEVNARYTNLGTNSKTKMALRATLKVTSTNAGGTTGGNTRVLRPF